MVTLGNPLGMAFAFSVEDVRPVDLAASPQLVASGEQGRDSVVDSLVEVELLLGHWLKLGHP